MTQTLELVQPSRSLRDSYRGLIAEFEDLREKLVPFVLGFENDNFDAFLARLEDCARGVNVPNGFVAHSTLWLVRDQTMVVGVSNIRHALTDALRREGGNIGYGIRPSVRRQGLGFAILQQSLRRASEIGLGRVLVTCAKTNVASMKSIVHNGGILESEEYLPDRNEVVQRYWIDNTPGANA